MNIRIRIALFIYLIFLSLLAIRGFQLLTYTEYLPYQSVVVGLPWNEVPANYRMLISFLNRYAGGLLLVFCSTMLVLSYRLYKTKEKWAVIAIPSILLAYCAASVNSLFEIEMSTGANTPLPFVAGYAGLLVLAFVISITGKAEAEIAS